MRAERNFRQRAAGLLILLACAIGGVWAQGNANIQIPYSCSFEDPQENGNWVINSGINMPVPDMFKDRWYIGQATFTDGLSSLYISNDGGYTTRYDAKYNVIVAYREIVLPDGNYDFSFDWKCNADPNSKLSGLYVCLVPQYMVQGPPQSDPNSSTISSMDMMWINYTYPIYTEGVREPSPLKGSLGWKNSSFQQQFSGNDTYYLTFAWVQDSKDTTIVHRVGACIDNIQITEAACGKPTNIRVETMCDTIKVAWDGICEKYDLEYKLNERTEWRRIPNIYANSYVLTGTNEGVYDFRIRGICNDTIYSAYAVKSGNLLFCAEEHCLDYTNLKEAARCYIGMFKAYEEDIFSLTAPIDLGSDDMRSRHTVNTIQNQYDPRTNYGLKTIPDGEVASIRLGNWNVGAEMERIEYQYTVDCDVASILLLKYAIVFEDPEHEKESQPHFDLVLLDETGKQIDATCGAANFFADRRAAGWNVYSNDYGNIIVWKDWTTLGVNLEPYDGQDITIQITARDCAASGHYGYAYFTLDCAAGEIESVSCGALDYMTVRAPDGFNYQWFKKYDYITDDKGVVVDSVPGDDWGTTQEIKIAANNRDVYYCRCSFKDDSDPSKAKCYFDLHTVVAPREPYAEIEWEWAPSNCQNIVKFFNRGHVLTVENGVTTHTSEPTQSVIWSYGDKGGALDNDPVYYAAAEGEELDVTLLVGISNDECQDDTTIHISIPSILCETDTVDSVVCGGMPVQWGSTVTSRTGYFPDSAKNVAGCDSVVVLNLTVLPPIPDTDVPMEICYGDSILFNGEWISEPGEHTAWLEAANTCDSVVVLNLTVRDEVEFDYEVTDVADEPRSGAIEITEAPEKYTYTLNGVEVAPLTHLNGGYYNLIVYDSVGCPSEEVEVFVNQECLEFSLTADSPYVACGDDEAIVLPCEFGAGAPTTYSIVYGEKAIAAGFVNYEDTFDVNEITIVLPDSCRPDVYTAELTVHDIICEDTVMPLTFSVYYPSDVVRQKWNNVLAVTNAEYNGGYEFAAFQWYKDGQPLAGETGSYLYLGEDNALDTAAEYHVMLTRADDGVGVPTCPVRPTIHTDVTEYPQPAASVAPAGAPMRILNVKEETDVMIFNAAGQLLTEERVDSNRPEVTVPTVPGVYMMVIQTESECSPYKIVVR